MLEQIWKNNSISTSTIFIGIALVLILLMGLHNLALMLGAFSLMVFALAQKSARSEPAWQQNLQESFREFSRQQAEQERQRWNRIMQEDLAKSMRDLEKHRKELDSMIKTMDLRPIQIPKMPQKSAPKPNSFEYTPSEEEKAMQRKLDSTAQALEIELEQLRKKAQEE